MFAAVILASAITFDTADPGASPAASFAAPPPRLIELLRKQHEPSAWFYLTTTSGRYEVRMAGIHEDGIAGITARKGAPPAAKVDWGNIARIEQRTSHFRLGQFLGLAAGAVAGGYAGAAIGNPEHGDLGAWTGLTIGALAGTWLGGQTGDRFAAARPWYEGQPAQGAAVAGTPDVSDRALQEFRKSSSESDLLRLRGTFGEFTGRASRIDALGFSGLARDAKEDLAFEVPPEPIGWNQISSIERRGNAAGHYAKIGVAIGAGILGTLAGVASAGFGNDERDVLGAVMIGGSIGGLAGAGVGAVIGSGVERWQPIYQSPLVAENAGAR